MTPTITFAADVAAHLKGDLQGRVLRIAFTTGCGGSGYRLSYADQPAEGDVVLHIDSIPVALDDMAARRLDGAVITWDADEDGYTLDHPDAASAIWCG
jgi:Fe-S cluster assembly iron-binding protein IscA